MPFMRAMLTYPRRCAAVCSLLLIGGVLLSPASASPPAFAQSFQADQLQRQTAPAPAPPPAAQPAAAASAPATTPAPPEPAAPPAPPSAAAARAWGIATSDLVVDPAVRFGVLPNGMRYALRRNTTPRSGVMVRMLFDIGSLAEAEDQRGLAHFLEHMAFNGSRNVPEGEMVRLLERNGLAFGADTNAATGIDAISYRLDLPRNTPELIDLSLMLMREIASELTLDPAAVDRERGVIAAEQLARSGFQLDNSVANLRFLLPTLTVADRLPGGTAEVVRTAPAQRLRDFYDAYYRPERTTLVLVGDMDIAAVEQALVTRFADWQGRGPAGADPSIGSMDLDAGPRATFYAHPALQQSVTISRYRAWEDRPPTRARDERYRLEGIAEGIVARRLQRIASAENAPIQSGGFSETGAWETFREASLSVVAPPTTGAWRAALTVAEQEYRRALEHGFTDAEVAEQVARYHTALRNRVASAATAHSAALAAQIMGAADGDDIVTSAADDLAAFEEALPRISASAVSAAFRGMMAGYGAPRIRVVSGALPTEGDALEHAAAILAAHDASSRVAVVAPGASDARSFAYTDFGPPGAVAADDRIADVDIRRIRFANNVRLNIRRTDFEAGRVSVRVRIDGGLVSVPRDDPLRYTLASFLPLGGLEAHSVDELQTMIAGRSVGLNFSVTDDGFYMQSGTTPGDLAFQLQLFAALTSHPGYRGEAIGQFRNAARQQYSGEDASPGAVLARQLPPILGDGDPRLAWPRLDDLLALDWAQLRPHLDGPLSRGTVEIAIVGDVDEAAAIAAVAATFGALPTRNADFADNSATAVRSFASDRSLRVLRHSGPPEQVALVRYWPTRDGRDQAETVRLNLLSEIMTLMLTEELRERLGSTYTPSSGSDVSRDWPGYGLFSISSVVNLRDVAAVEAAMDSIVAQLRDAPVSDDVFARARAPVVESAMQSRRTNGYWLYYTGYAQADAALLDRYRNYMAVVEAITPADLQAVARRYLTGDAMLAVRVLPQGAEVAEISASPAGETSSGAAPSAAMP